MVSLPLPSLVLVLVLLVIIGSEVGCFVHIRAYACTGHYSIVISRPGVIVAGQKWCSCIIVVNSVWNIELHQAPLVFGLSHGSRQQANGQDIVVSTVVVQ